MLGTLSRVYIRVIRRFGLCLIALWGCCVAQEEPHIRVDVRLVNVAFAVRDTAGHLLTNLTKDDFEVLDDGQPQAISYFARSADLRLTLGLVVDVSGSQEHFVKQHEKDLEQFLRDVLTPRDRAFLLRFGNHLRLGCDFSSSPEELVDGLRGQSKSFRKRDGAEYPEIVPDLREGGTAYYDALYYATMLKLASAEGPRKAIVMFSDGEDNSSAHHMLDVIEAAQRENVILFGLRYTETARGGRLTARNRYGISVMARLARDTGGLDFDAQKANLHDSFQAIGEQLRSSYELAYHSTVPSDGTFHKLVIRAKKPGLIVRTKTGYFGRQ
ncbi:MAG: VWA domain-containing protein [Acidobacteriaceae bacterium]|nr:VWA domain-containing protein [Acidobacteriaceae bacterium]